MMIGCVCVLWFGHALAGVAELLTAESGALLSASDKRRAFHLEARSPKAGSVAARAVAGLSAAPPCVWFVEAGDGGPSAASDSGGVPWPEDTADVAAFMQVRGPATSPNRVPEFFAFKSVGSDALASVPTPPRRY